MVRIGTVSRLDPVQPRPGRRAPDVMSGTDAEPGQPPARALTIIDGGQPDGRQEALRAERAATGRPRAGFVAQLLTADDPTLQPSRLERTRMAAARYAEAARRLA